MSNQTTKLSERFADASLFQLTSWTYSCICFVDGIMCSHTLLLVAGAVPIAYSVLFGERRKA